jgi:hypothetical protein
MEERIGEDNKSTHELGLPLWITILYFIIEVSIIVVSVYRYTTGYMSEMGLVVGMLAIFCIADIFRNIEIQEMSEYYEDKIADLESKVNTIDQENSELRTIMKNSQRTKTKKND